MNRYVFLFLALLVLIGIGCARVKVEGSKEPIKLDVSMRVDIYQHVVKDIDEIENIVAGSDEKPKATGAKQGSFLRFLEATAYAQEGLSPEVEKAALNRKARRDALSGYEAKGVIGENKSGYVEIRGSGDSIAQDLVSAENADRRVIYQSVADKNGVSVSEVERLYAKRLQQDAPSGAPIEALNEPTGSYAWTTK